MKVICPSCKVVYNLSKPPPKKVITACKKCSQKFVIDPKDENQVEIQKKSDHLHETEDTSQKHNLIDKAKTIASQTGDQVKRGVERTKAKYENIVGPQGIKQKAGEISSEIIRNFEQKGNSTRVKSLINQTKKIWGVGFIGKTVILSTCILILISGSGLTKVAFNSIDNLTNKSSEKSNFWDSISESENDNDSSFFSSKRSSESSEYVYVCRYCGDVETASSRPEAGRCSARNAPHGWEKVGKAGEKRYRCKKCGTRVRVKSYASSTGCPEGGSHSWTAN